MSLLIHAPSRAWGHFRRQGTPSTHPSPSTCCTPEFREKQPCTLNFKGWWVTDTLPRSCQQAFRSHSLLFFSSGFARENCFKILTFRWARISFRFGEMQPTRKESENFGGVYSLIGRSLCCDRLRPFAEKCYQDENFWAGGTSLERPKIGNRKHLCLEMRMLLVGEAANVTNEENILAREKSRVQ